MHRHRWKILTGIALAFVLLTGIEVMTTGNGPRREVEAYKKSLIAKGEKLDISELLPPPVPPEQNGADIVKQALSLLTPEDQDFSNSVPAMRMIGPGKATVCFEQPEVRTRRDITNSWANELAVVADDQPMIELLRQAMNYPAIDFHVNYEDSSDMGQHVGPLSWCMRRLSAAAICDLHLGVAGSAATNICTILALFKGQQDGRLPFYQGIRLEWSFLPASANWELLQSSNVNDQELALLQRSWERIEYFHGLVRDLTMDRAYCESQIMKMRAPDDYFNKATRPYYRNVDWSDGLAEGLSDLFNNAELGCAKSMYLASWTYSDELRMLRSMQALLETARAAATNQVFNPAYSNMVAQLNAMAMDGPRDWITNIDDPGLRNMFSGYSSSPELVGFAMQAEATRRIVITAIALKRYQLKHGDYPSSLADLVPQFLSSVPRDPVDGQPLRYRRMADGRFLLYSIGENGKDDGGDGSVPIRTANNFRFRWTNPDALDWVWPQPATPAEIQAYYAHPPPGP